MNSGDLADIEHWVTVYEELAGFKDRLLDELAEQRQNVLAAGQPELENDERLLRAEADRLHRRLDYWRRELNSR